MTECPTCGAPIGVLETMRKAAEVSDTFFNWPAVENHSHLVDAAQAFLKEHTAIGWTPEKLVADYEHRA